MMTRLIPLIVACLIFFPAKSQRCSVFKSSKQEYYRIVEKKHDSGFSVQDYVFSHSIERGVEIHMYFNSIRELKFIGFKEDGQNDLRIYEVLNYFMDKTRTVTFITFKTNGDGIGNVTITSTEKDKSEMKEFQTVSYTRGKPNKSLKYINIVFVRIDKWDDKNASY